MLQYVVTRSYSRIGVWYGNFPVTTIVFGFFLQILNNRMNESIRKRVNWNSTWKIMTGFSEDRS